ncbi:hypothetical protein CHS0354_019976 [Potamilus streckersoni]|uniref:Caspase-2 n=1 Tax=Potamilus streckersoni TaxID=2493646 RepID=A0AAE0S6P7_9BIVA|nr:hypothetical protein CHS0354_019976 [Potamilus streckersoni]
MDEAHKEILRKSRVKIVEDLLIDDILDKLLEKEVFTAMMLEYIMAEKARPDQVRKLIDNLQRRGPDAYDKFILCLREGGHAHLANYILNTEAELRGWSLPYNGTSRNSVSEQSSQTMEPILSLLHVQETGHGNAGQNMADTRGELESMDDSDDSNQNTFIPVQDTQMEGDAVPYIVALSTSQYITESSNKGYTGGKEQYSMESNPRGLVLIINNREFDKQKPRPGTEYDGTMLRDMFIHLGFAVDQICDLTAFGMKEKLKHLAEYPMLHYVDSLVVVILSHGLKDDTVCGVDGSVVKYDEITELFDSKNCPLLHHKPKLFIINACRGDKENTGSQGSSIQADRVDPDIVVIPPRPKGNAFQSQPIPTLQDMVIAASTLPGHVSWRDDNKGSWFIQAIVEVFQEFSKTHHILDMLVRVNRRVAQNLHKNKVQLPQSINMLTKDWFLNPI